MPTSLDAVESMLISALLLASCYLWMGAIRKVLAGAPILKLQRRRPVPWGLVDLAVIIFAMLIVLGGGQMLLLQWIGEPVNPTAKDPAPWRLALVLLVNGIGMLVGCGFAVALVKLRAGASWSDLGFAPRQFARDIRIGVAGFVMLAPPMYLLQWALTELWFKSEHPVQTLVMREPSAVFILTSLMTAVVVAPLTEELFFRVLFQGWLENVALMVDAFFRQGKTVGDDRRGAPVAHFDSVFLGGPREGALENELEDAMATGAAPAEDPTSAAAPPTRIEEPHDLETNPVKQQAILKNDGARSVRGLIWQSIVQYAPIAISAEVFASMHQGYGPDPIPLLFLALGLGYIYQRTHRATPGIVVHFLVNSVSMVVLLIALLTGELPQHP